MPFDYINSLDSQTRKNNGHKTAGNWFLFICFLRVVMVLLGLLTCRTFEHYKTRYRLMRPVMLASHCPEVDTRRNTMIEIFIFGSDRENIGPFVRAS